MWVGESVTIANFGSCHICLLGAFGLRSPAPHVPSKSELWEVFQAKLDTRELQELFEAVEVNVPGARACSGVSWCTPWTQKWSTF